MVFAWHFMHHNQGYPVPFEFAPAIVPLALLDEGHTGVALFMTLSGYLFAKLLDGKKIRYGAFLWNRVLRLLPLLLIVLVLAGTFWGPGLAAYSWQVLQGVLLPTLPNGAWSITIEFHFYVILPVFLWLLAKSRFLPLALVVAAIAVRAWLYSELGEIQSLAYWTLIGRIDQFVLGMLAYHFRGSLAGRHALVWTLLGAFFVFYWSFDVWGGYVQFPSYPSPSRWWIVLTTIEGVAYALGIAWYDNSFTHSTTGVSRFIGRIGEYSYSIYLLHFFVVYRAAHFVNEHVMNISNFYVACAWALALFSLMIVPGYLSYRFIESPFLRMRRRYVVGATPPG